MHVIPDRPTVEKLLHRAAFVAQLAGHLNRNHRLDVTCQLSDYVDANVQKLTKPLGDPRTSAALDVELPDDRAKYHATPTRMISSGGAQ